MVIFFIMILVNLNSNKYAFFTPGNIILTIGCALIIRMHFYFDTRYQVRYFSTYEKMPKVLRTLFFDRGLFKSYFGLFAVTSIFWAISKTIQKNGETVKPVWLAIYNFKNMFTLFAVSLYWMGGDGYTLLRTQFMQMILPQFIYWSTLVILVI